LLGLSPDGSTLLYPDMKDARQWIVANPDGSRRDTLNLPPPQTPVGWLRASTLIVASGGFVRRLRTMSLVDGSAQLLADNATSFAEPQLSSDGSTVMMMIRGSRAAIHLRGVDGSAVRTLQLPEAGAGSPSWSPDQKWIAYIAYGEDPKPHVSMVEVATGRVQTVYEFDNDQTVVIRWRTDSQALVLSNIVTKPPEARRVVFRSVDLAGRMTVLRDVPLGPPPSGGVAIGDAAALLIRNGQKDYRVIRLDGDPSERELPVQTTDGSPVMITSDTQWAAVRQAPAAATAGSPATMLDIARIDGSARWTISLPFVMLGIPPRPVPGADAFVVFEARRPDADTGVYLVSARTNTVRKLFTYAPQTGLPEITVSADGRRLVYLISEPIPPQVQAIDLSAPRREKE
jgi:dipeptidyl aminopeptidase/acylaminoacyl peptidase